MKKILALLMVFSMAIIFLMAFTFPQDQKEGKPWDIPEKYKKMENPHKGDKRSVRIGKMLYSKNCKSCHGSEGAGDGPRARQLEPHPNDFRTEEFQEQKAGVLYYKSFIGRGEMPNFEKEIPVEEDRWAIINYMRTFGK